MCVWIRYCPSRVFGRKNLTVDANNNFLEEWHAFNRNKTGNPKQISLPHMSEYLSTKLPSADITFCSFTTAPDDFVVRADIVISLDFDTNLSFGTDLVEEAPGAEKSETAAMPIMAAKRITAAMNFVATRKRKITLVTPIVFDDEAFQADSDGPSASFCTSTWRNFTAMESAARLIQLPPAGAWRFAGGTTSGQFDCVHVDVKDAAAVSDQARRRHRRSFTAVATSPRAVESQAWLAAAGRPSYNYDVSARQRRVDAARCRCPNKEDYQFKTPFPFEFPAEERKKYDWWPADDASPTTFVPAAIKNHERTGQEICLMSTLMSNLPGVSRRGIPTLSSDVETINRAAGGTASGGDHGSLAVATVTQVLVKEQHECFPNGPSNEEQLDGTFDSVDACRDGCNRKAAAAGARCNFFLFGRQDNIRTGLCYWEKNCAPSAIASSPAWDLYHVVPIYDYTNGLVSGVYQEAGAPEQADIRKVVETVHSAVASVRRAIAAVPQGKIKSDHECAHSRAEDIEVSLGDQSSVDACRAACIAEKGDSCVYFIFGTGTEVTTDTHHHCWWEESCDTFKQNKVGREYDVYQVTEPPRHPTGSAPTAEQINLWTGVSGATPDVARTGAYDAGFRAGVFVDRGRPTALEIQKVVNTVNAKHANPAASQTKTEKSGQAHRVTGAIGGQTAAAINAYRVGPAQVSCAVESREHMYLNKFAQGRFSNPPAIVEVQVAVDEANAAHSAVVSDVNGGGKAATAEEINIFLGLFLGSSSAAVDGRVYSYGFKDANIKDLEEPTGIEIKDAVSAVNDEYDKYDAGSATPDASRKLARWGGASGVKNSRSYVRGLALLLLRTPTPSIRQIQQAVDDVNAAWLAVLDDANGNLDGVPATHRQLELASNSKAVVADRDYSAELVGTLACCCAVAERRAATLVSRRGAVAPRHVRAHTQRQSLFTRDTMCVYVYANRLSRAQAKKIQGQSGQS